MKNKKRFKNPGTGGVTPKLDPFVSGMIAGLGIGFMTVVTDKILELSRQPKPAPPAKKKTPLKLVKR